MHDNGIKVIKCETEEEFKAFILSSDSLQAFSNIHDIIGAANIFNLNINIFTYGPKLENPRWTQIVPNSDICDGNKQNLEVNLYHSDENHFDLLLEKDKESTEKQNNLEDGVKDNDKVAIEDLNKTYCLQDKSASTTDSSDSNVDNVISTIKSVNKDSIKCNKCESLFVSSLDLLNHMENVHE